MSEHFEKVKSYLLELGHTFSKEDKEEELVIINDVKKGIINLVIDCEYPILIFEQYIFDLNENTAKDVYKRLLQINRTLVHGAFVLDESGTKVLFHDTLQLENLDLNEIEGTINALGMAMAENSMELLKFAKEQ